MGAIHAKGGVLLVEALACPTSRHSPSRGSFTCPAICTSISGPGSITFSTASTMPSGTSASSSRQNSTDCSTNHSGKYTSGMKPPCTTRRVTPSACAVSMV